MRFQMKFKLYLMIQPTFSYGEYFSNVLLLWGIQIIDYQLKDDLLINISNIFGDDYGEFIQTA